MTSSMIKKTCFKCNKNLGTAMCYGCEQAFCTKHFIEHRQDLSQQMDSIGQEHDLLQRDLTHEYSIHPLLERVNQWEEESITKIHLAAQSARTYLQQLLNKPKNHLKTSVSKMTEELQTSRDLDDYTEVDIRKWIDQLREFRKVFDNPINVSIDYEKDIRSAIRLIKVNDQHLLDSFQRPTRSSPTFLNEKFDDSFGKITLSEGGLVATCLGSHIDRSCVSTTGRYSLGIHYIHFRIEQTSTHYQSFFGVVHSSEKLTNDICNAISLHGWWDLDYTVISGKNNRQLSSANIRMGDEVTLMLDCLNRRIQLEHPRTNRTVTMSVDLQLCPFPWKIIVLLPGKDDCVRIVH